MRRSISLGDTGSVGFTVSGSVSLVGSVGFTLSGFLGLGGFGASVSFDALVVLGSVSLVASVDASVSGSDDFDGSVGFVVSSSGVGEGVPGTTPTWFLGYCWCGICCDGCHRWWTSRAWLAGFNHAVAIVITD